MKFLKRLGFGALALVAVIASGRIVTAQSFNPATLVGVTTVVKLRTQTFNPVFYPYLYTIGYNTSGDGGGGLLYAHSGSTDNGCTKFHDVGNNEFDRVSVGTPLSVNQCGADNTGTSNSATAFTNALAISTNVSCEAGKTYLIGATVPVALANTTLSGCLLAPQGLGANYTLSVNVNGFTGYGLYFLGGVNGVPTGEGSGIVIGNSASISHTTLVNLTCNGAGSGGSSVISACVDIKNATDTKISGVTFISTCEGIEGLPHGAQLGVQISNLYATDMYCNAILENSIDGNPTNWTITNFDFEGSHDYPTPETEERFAAFTDAVGIIISDGYVQHVAGDGAFHFEGPASAIKLSHINAKDDLASGGYDGLINANSGSNNITTDGIHYIYATPNSGNTAHQIFDNGGNGHANPLSFNNDWCDDQSGSALMGCYSIQGQTGGTTINGSRATLGNLFINLGGGATNITISTTTNLAEGSGLVDTSGAGTIGLAMTGNQWDDNTWNVQGGGGSGAPNSWSISGNNHFTSNSGSGHNGMQVTGCVNCWNSSNWFSSNLINHTIATSPGTDTVDYKNFVQATGVVP